MSTCLHPICVRGTLVPCGKCPVCLQNRRQALSNRMLLEMAYCGGNTFFTTLTVDDDHMSFCLPPNAHTGEYVPCFRKDIVQKFIKRVRKRGYKFTYFLTSEYGDISDRIHYHALFFCRRKYDIEHFQNDLQECWYEGFVEVSPATDRRISYCAKYCLKDDFKHVFDDTWDCRKTFRLFSQKPGIGECAVPFLNEYIFNDGDIRKEFEIDGKMITFDRYFKDHIDPSLGSELRSLTYYDRFYEIQERLLQSRTKHSNTLSIDRDPIPDYTEDSEIMKRRFRLRMMKKGHFV